MQSTQFRVRHGIIVETSNNTSTAIVANNQVLSGSASNALVDLATTWNTTGNPTALKLNVTNTASGANSALMDLQVGGSSRFKVAANGNIGIGTSSPTSKLHLANNTSNEIQVEITSPSNFGSAALTFKNDIGITAGWALMNSTRNNYGVITANNLTAYTASVAGISMMVDAAGPIKFAAGGAAERMRIDSTGNIGIGITSPTAKLTVANSTSATSAHIYGAYTDGSNYERINLTANSTGHYVLGEEAGTGLPRSLFLGANNATAVTIDTAGRVGIGTTTPRNALEVLNGIRLSTSGAGNPSAHTLLIEADYNSRLVVPTIKFAPGGYGLTSYLTDGVYLNIGQHFSFVSWMTGNGSQTAYDFGTYGNTWSSVTLPAGYVGNVVKVSSNILSEATANFFGVNVILGDNSANTVTNIVTGLKVDVSGGTNNSSSRYAATFIGGNVGVNITNPSAKLHVNGDAIITGNLTVSGNVAVIGANNLSVVDNFIYLNSDNNTQNVDLGIAGNYNDGTYRHTGFFRDASDGYYKVFDNYGPEPDASVNIDTADATFRIANFWSNTNRFGNTTVYATINSTSYAAGNSTSNSAFTHSAGALSLFTAGSEHVTVAANGNVGIGITSPTTKFQVVGTSTFGTVSRNATIGLSSTTGQVELNFNGSDSNASRIFTNENDLVISPNTGIIRVGSAYSTSGPLYIGKMSSSYGTYGSTGWGLKTGSNVPLVFESIATDINTDVFAFNQTVSGGRYLFNVLSNGSSRLMINSSGNVGIGTSSPTAKLHSYVTSTAGGVTDKAGFFQSLAGPYAATNYGVHGYASTVYGTAYGVYGEVLDVDANALALAYGGYFKASSGGTTGLASIYGLYVENIAAVAGTSYGIVSKTVSGAGTVIPFQLLHNSSELMRVAANGNVGINTTTLSGKLNIDTGADSLAVRIGAISSTGSEINLGIGILNAGRPFIGTNTNTNPLDFGTRSNVPIIFYTNSTEKMRISGAGNVGIGTAAPISRFTVVDATAKNGTINLGDDVSYNGKLEYIFSTGEFRLSQVGGASLGTTFYTNGSERMRISSTGRVGIGTINPRTVLNVYDGTTTPTITIDGETGVSNIATYPTIAFTSGGYHTRYTHAKITTSSSAIPFGPSTLTLSAAVSNTELMNSWSIDGNGGLTQVSGAWLSIPSAGITFSGTGGSERLIQIAQQAGTNVSGIPLKIKAGNGNPGGDAAGGNLFLFGGSAYASGSGANGNVIIAHNDTASIGNVGIGTNNPTSKLTVANGTSPTSQHLYGTFTDASNYERINFTANSTGHYVLSEEAGTGTARSLYLGANNATVLTVNSDKSVVVKDKLYGRSSIDHVTYSIFEASVDGVYIANEYSRSGIGYPPGSLYIGGLADGRDAFRLNANTIYLGAKTSVVRTQANPNTTNWVSGGSFSVISNPGSDNFAFGIDDNRTYGWLQYWSGGTATNISINPLGGNVGIGTSSPSQKLEISSSVTNNGGDNILRISNPASSVSSRVDLVAGNVDNENPYFVIKTRQNGAPYAQIERIRIDAAGNIGIGTTQNAWDTGGTGKSIQFPSGAVANYDNNSGNYQFWMFNNSYRDNTGTFKYLKSSFASYYSMNNVGDHVWFVAPSGTAGNVISFTEAMKISANGNVGIGTTSPTSLLHVTSAIYPVARIERSTTVTSGTRSSFASVHKTTGDMTDTFGTDVSFIIRDSANVDNEIALFGAYRDGADNSGTLIFATYNAGVFGTKMFIKPDGNVGIGIGVPTAKLTVANGTSPTSQHIYGTYTDGSNYERINFTANSTGHYVRGEEAGTGLPRPLYLGANNATHVTITEGGNVGIGTDNTPGTHGFIFEPANKKLTLGTSNASGGTYLISGAATGGSSPVHLTIKPGDYSSTAPQPSADLNLIGGSRTNASDTNYKGGKVVIQGGSATLGYGEVVLQTSGGNVGIGTSTPAYKLEVAGSFAATTKSFVIDHQGIPGKKLRHGSLEGPENGVYVRGKTTSNVIKLPDYWSWLVDEESITVQLTSIGRRQDLYVLKIEDNKVYIAGDSNINCFYMINAERKDVDKLVVEY